MTKQTLNFQAEVAQLLHLVTHSLYSNKEIFLRELISNASDACDKLRFEAINAPDLLESDAELKVKVTFDKDAKTLTITDNGIGLSEQEAIDNLGTIAKSGTKDFVSKLSGDQKADSQLIGQVGQKRGLRGGPPVLKSARSAYLGTEWSGKSDRRPPKGLFSKTDA